jgi:hypothetical protein
MQINGMRSVLRQATRKPKDKLNVLCSPVHERVQSQYAKTGHNFYLVQTENFKGWNSEYAPLPANFVLLDRNLGNDQIPKDVGFDLILSENRFGQYQFFKQLQKIYHLNIIQAEHTAPYDTWSPIMRQQLRSFSGDINVFITDWSRKQWGWDESNSIVIPHTVDTELFCPDENIPKIKTIGAVVNDWINRDQPCGFNLWKRITQGLPVKPMGATPGLSEAAKSLDELVNHYRACQVFVNTSLISPIPCALLEAAACGAGIVTTATCAIPEFFTDEYDAFVTNDESTMRRRLKQLLDSPKLCDEMGKRARETVISKCGLEQYLETWNKLFYQAANTVYTG